MQKYFRMLNLTKNVFKADAQKYSLFLKNESLTIASKAKNSSITSGLSVLLSLYGLYATKEMLCEDKIVPTDKKAQLYAWGGNQYGQLGIGSDVNKPTPERVEVLDEIQIALIAAKPAISTALSTDGRVFTWGGGKTGALGHQIPASTNVSLPEMVESILPYQFSQVGSGKYHMAAITRDGHLYTWGNMSHGVLGHTARTSSVTSKKAYDPKSALESLIQAPERVLGELSDKICVQVACGTQHTLCLTSDSQVYSWGSARGGALGYSEIDDVKAPKKIPFFADKKVVKIASGSDFNYALTQDGRVYSWGSNYFGQLGTQSANGSETPALISTLYGIKITDIVCGENFGAAISDKGKLYTWGYGNEGQLGHGNRNDLKTPKLLEFDKKIVAADCGSSHTGVITNDGELYMFGRGREGQLGRADAIESSVTYRTTPQRVSTFKNKKVVSVACGGDHTIALVQ